MTHFHLFDRDRPRRPPAPPPPADPPPSGPAEGEPEGDDAPPDDRRKNPRQTIRGKVEGGLYGLRAALRGDSSYFAHAYRGLLIALTATILGIGPLEWCFLVVAAALVLGSELFHSALARLARSAALADDRDVLVAREIGAGAVVVASVLAAVITLTILGSRLGTLLGW